MSVLFIRIFIGYLPLWSQVISHFPRFSWDYVPLYMHMRKSTAFTPEELEYLAGFPLITLEKTTGSTTYGSTEEGSRQTARAIKSISPESGHSM